MARVTVEDCILKIPNRFELVMMAAQRARDIAAGSPLSVDRDNDKNPVVALREIADETVDAEVLRSTLVKGLQKHVEVDEPEEDEMDLLAIQQEFGAAASPGQPGEGIEEADADGDEADDADEIEDAEADDLAVDDDGDESADAEVVEED